MDKKYRIAKLIKRMVMGMVLAAVVCLTVSGVWAGQPDAKAAMIHVQAMLEEGNEMIRHGEQGHLDIMVRHAEMMIEHAREAIEATPPDSKHGKEAVAHLKEAIGHAEEAIARARRGRGDVAMAHADKAMAHARRGAKYSEEI